MAQGIDLLGSSDIYYPSRVPNEYVAATINSATGTGSTTLVTGAPGYYLQEIFLQVDLTATIASAGMISCIFSDSSYGQFFVFRIYLPSSAGTSTIPVIIRQTNGPGFYWSNKTANSVASVALNTALTAGSIRVGCRYGITNIVG